MDMQLASTAATGAFSFFMPIAKVDKEKRTVSGYASTPTQDSDGEVVSLKAVKDALPGYMQYGNIREMHKISAVGVAKEANIDEKGLYLTAKIVDDAAWKKCTEGVYKGFSIGGQKLAKTGNIITKIDMAEISVVDRPANPDCKIDIMKAAKPVPETEAEAVLVKVRAPRTPEAKAAMALAKTVKNLLKGDGFSAPAKGEGENPPPDVATLGKEGGEGGNKSPYGDVEYADPGHQADKKKRYPVDTPDHIRSAWSYINKPKNAGKYSPEDAASVKAKIVSAWKSHIDKEGPPSAKGKVKKVKYAQRMAKAFAEVEQLALVPHRDASLTERRSHVALPASGLDFLSLGKVTKGDLSIEPPPTDDFLSLPLKKGMGAASSLTYAFSSIRDAQRSLMLEGKDEGGDGKDQQLAKRLGLLAKDLAGVIGDKALHEGDEAVTMTDTDDRWVNQSLGKAKKMSKEVSSMIQEAVRQALFGGEPLAKGEKKTPLKDCMKAAGEDMKEAKKARKSAMADIEKAHSMLKANYLAKATKAKGKEKPEPDDDGDDNTADCMKALSSAYASMQKAAGFEKSVKTYLAKADSMVSVSPTTGCEEYVVPAGVKSLSITDLAEGGPPPLYESDVVYPGKAAGAGNLAKFAKNGMISVEMAQLLADNERLQGQVEVMGNQPRSGKRPYNFGAMAKAVGGDGSGAQTDAAKTIFEGVDVSAIGSGNEEMHKAATARALGNLLLAPKLAKSIMDPGFKGTAGIKH